MEDWKKFPELILAMQSNDKSTRSQAEQLYGQLRQTQADQFLVHLTQCVDPALPEEVRVAAAVLLRRQVDRTHENDFLWTCANAQTHATIKTTLLQVLVKETSRQVARTVGKICVTLGSYLCDPETAAAGGWPELLPSLVQLATSPQVDLREVAVSSLGDLCAVLKDQLMGNQQVLGSVLEAGLTDPEASCRSFAVKMICDMVDSYPKQDWQKLTTLVPHMLEAVKFCAEKAMAQPVPLQRCLEHLIDTCSDEPMFFKAHLADVMELMFQLIAAKDNVDEEQRRLALEFVQSMTHERPKMVVKSVPNFAHRAIQACLQMMAEIEENPEWVDKLDDEEGDEDEDQCFQAGEECVDRIVEALTIEVAGPALFQLVGEWIAKPRWEEKHAALYAIKQTVEYIDDDHIEPAAQLLLQHVNHEHMRIRYAAHHGIGQLATDKEGVFQEKMSVAVVEALIQCFDDPVNRVAAMAMSAFVTFGEELDTADMGDYAEPLMNKLVNKLKSQHRGIQEESLTCIAVIAGVLEGDFAQYYDAIMPMVKEVIITKTGEKEHTLRGKAFECVSLLGMAVGKAKFMEDARQAMVAMTSSTFQPDDVQREYIMEATNRICITLKKDFAQFLGPMLQIVFSTISMENMEHKSTGDPDEDDDVYEVTAADGRSVKVHTRKLEEMQQAMRQLETFVRECGSTFKPHVAGTARALMPFIEKNDNVACLLAEVRDESYGVWAELIKINKDEPAVMNELLSTFIRQVLAIMNSETDGEIIGKAAEGLRFCMNHAGAGAISAEEVSGLTEVLLKKMAEAKERKMKMDAFRDPDDEEDRGDSDDEEEECRAQLNAVFGSLMQCNKEAFKQHSSERVVGQGKAWLASKDTYERVLGINLVCDLLCHLKEESVPAWPMVMQPVIGALLDADAGVRQAAAYAMNLGARIPQFAEAAPQVFETLVKIVANQKIVKSNDKKAGIARDNAIAAVFELATHHPTAAPQGVDAFGLVLQKLPLKFDDDESSKVTKKLLEMVKAENKALLGQDNSRLPAVIGHFADVYSTEYIEDEVKDELTEFFKVMPANLLTSVMASFSDKQKKKVSRIMANAAQA